MSYPPRPPDPDQPYFDPLPPDHHAYPPADYSPVDYSPPGHPPAGHPPAGHLPAGHLPPDYPRGDHAPADYPPSSYPHADYRPDGYPQADYPPAGYSAAGDGYPDGFLPTPQKSRTLPVVLITVAVLLVLGGGGLAAIFLLPKDQTDKMTTTSGKPDLASSAASGGQDPTGQLTTGPTPNAPVPTGGTPTGGAQTDATPTGGTQTGPTQTGPTPTGGSTADPTNAPGTTRTLVEPATLGGRPKLTDPQAIKLTETMKRTFNADPDTADAISALYSSANMRDGIMVAAALDKTTITDQGPQLNAMLRGIETSGKKLTGVTAISAGPLGGKAKCGNTTGSGVKVAVCAWVDKHTYGLVLWYFKQVKQVKSEFPALRAQIEKAS